VAAGTAGRTKATMAPALAGAFPFVRVVVMAPTPVRRQICLPADTGRRGCGGAAHEGEGDMSVIQLPMVRRGRSAERSALRRGLAVVVPAKPLQVVPVGALNPRAFCAGCAGPIEFGAVTRGRESFCSVECSLGGDRPA
jgi:hypothetical protein